MYDHFVITLDSTPISELTLDYVITHLLNEEARELANTPTKSNTPRNAGVAALATSSSEKPGSHTGYRPARSLANITCFRCGQKGHYQANCPIPPPSLQVPPSPQLPSQTPPSTNITILDEICESW